MLIPPQTRRTPRTLRLRKPLMLGVVLLVLPVVLVLTIEIEVVGWALTLGGFSIIALMLAFLGTRVDGLPWLRATVMFLLPLWIGQSVIAVRWGTPHVLLFALAGTVGAVLGGYLRHRRVVRRSSA
ncbi:MAG: hypothetical protein AAGJ10_09425 [Bacteroidota bacterium]